MKIQKGFQEMPRSLHERLKKKNIPIIHQKETTITFSLSVKFYETDRMEASCFDLQFENYWEVE